MGQTNNVLRHYLDHPETFADLFNGVLFGGKMIVDAKELTEASEQYIESDDGILAKSNMEKGKYISRNRDLRKYLNGRGILRILAVENQNQVDYSMPFRCMEYDTLEYRRQLENLHRKNEKTDSYATAAERLCRVRKDDRLHPVYTLCLYHGEQPWDGPRSMKDMMEFGEKDPWESYFADYPMLLYCINEENDFSAFHTELRELLQAMQYRKDKKKLKRLFEENEAYRHLSEETVEAIAVVMDAPELWRKRDMYRSVKDDEKAGYNMCQGLREWIEDERNAGRAEGKAEDILDLLAEKGEVPQMLREYITNQDDANVLKKWLLTAAKADTIQEFETRINLPG